MIWDMTTNTCSKIRPHIGVFFSGHERTLARLKSTIWIQPITR